MYTVLDPSIIFISEGEWKNLQKRDIFITHLLNNLKYIDSFNITKIYWTNFLENSIWESPQIPPWRKDIIWRNSLVPIIYKLLHQNKRILNSEIQFNTCEVKPSIKYNYNKNDIHEHFLKLMHYMINQNNSLYFCLSKVNIIPKSDKYIFSCDCHHNELIPILINEPSDWLFIINVADIYWPKEYNDNELKKLRNGIEIIEKRFYIKYKLKIIYDYEFSKEFICKILNEKKHRLNILNDIVLRLSLEQKKASQNSRLKDEPVIGKKNIRRFRIRYKDRVHYKYADKEKIFFLHYYKEGEHNKGLK